MKFHEQVEALREAEIKKSEAEAQIEKTKQSIKQWQIRLKNQLQVGRQVPCKIAQLSSEEFVVHVYREGGPTSLYFVSLTTDIDLD